VRPRAARKARNPRTGRQVEVPEKFVVSFKPGKVMEERVNAIGTTPLAQAIRDAVASGQLEVVSEDEEGSMVDESLGESETGTQG